jgi:hypothetical protein
MTMQVLAQRELEERCETHDRALVELLVRSDRLRYDWSVVVCPECSRNGEAPSGGQTALSDRLPR